MSSSVSLKNSVNKVKRGTENIWKKASSWTRMIVTKHDAEVIITVSRE